jgi:N-acyl-D-aspartate/D-glutamate deacylase
MRTTLVRDGLFFDGTGAPATRSDLLIRDGRVAEVAPAGSLAGGDDCQVIDADGCWVLPGFLDTHTHYDGELALAPALSESVRHGVTTVVIGCCSVSFVAADAEDCSDMFTRVEAVPREVVLPALRELKRWDSPRGWRGWIDALPHGPNVASFLGHSDIRCRAMGLERAVSRRARPTGAELRLMERLLHEALDCGFLGLSGMTNPWDKLDGERAWSRPLPSVFARGRELRRLRRILRRRGFIHQTAPNLVTRVNILGMVLAGAGLGRRALKTTLIAMMDLKADTYIFKLTSAAAWLANTALRGDFRWQSPPVPFDLYYDGMDSVLFEEFPTGEAIRDLAHDRAGRDRLLRDPSYRRRFRRELHKRLAPKVWHRDLGDAVILDAPDPDLVGRSFVDVARARGADPVDTFLDLMSEHDRALRWHTRIANHRPEVLAEILRHRGTLMSFADSGAHLRNMAFYNFPVRMLKRVRDAELAGAPIMPIEAAVHRLTGELGAWFGLDAGRLRPGDRADVIVLDPARLDDEVEKITERAFPGLPGFNRLVNEGSAVREVLIGGRPAVEGGVVSEQLGQERRGVFLEARP